MATRKVGAKPGPRPRRWRRIALLGAVIAAGLAWTWHTPIRNHALTATAFSARVVCSCRYVGGRPSAQCRDDLEPGTGLVLLSEDDDAKSVTARIPLLAVQTATWRKGPGCVLEPWQD
jgi:hypothetical protein